VSLDFNPENRTTWLEAINAVLLKTGRPTLASAPTDGVALDPEADAVRNHLDRVTREVLSSGWNFNTVRRTLTVTAGEIVLDDDILEFDPGHPNIAAVNDKLLKKDTDLADDFSESIEGWAIIAHDLADCPEVMRQYIIARTAVEIASSHFAENEFLPRLQLEEARARGRLWSSGHRTRNRGLKSNYDVARHLGLPFRRSAYYK
jgi:hypothetical protein